MLVLHELFSIKRHQFGRTEAPPPNSPTESGEFKIVVPGYKFNYLGWNTVGTKGVQFLTKGNFPELEELWLGKM